MSKIYKSINEIGVNAIYDGNHLDMDVFVNENGKKTKMHTILDNEDLNRLFHIPIVSVPLEQRLQQDFLQKENIPIPTPKHITIVDSKEPFLRPEEGVLVIKPKKKKTKKNKKEKKKTKKSMNLYKTPSPKLVHIHLKKKKSI